MNRAHNCERCSQMMNRTHNCERCSQLFTVAHSCPRLFTPETGPQSRDAMKHAPHHTTCEHCAGSAVHGLAASATARARYLAPLARCALLQTAMVEHCTRTTARQNSQSSCLQQDVADVYSSPVDTMNRNQTATNRDIMMRFQARHYSAYMQSLFVQSERPLSVFTPETGPHVGGVANRAVHHTGT